jgi:hypothetical protein
MIRCDFLAQLLPAPPILAVALAAPKVSGVADLS